MEIVSFCVVDAIKSIDKHSCVRLIVKSTESTSSYCIEKVQTLIGSLGVNLRGLTQ